MSLIAHAKVLSALIGMLGNGGDLTTLPLGLVGLLYPVLGACSVAGLWRLRPWGFHAFYAHLIVGTLLLGISYIPFLPALLPPELRIWAVIGINLLTLFAVSAVHRRVIKGRP